MTKTNTTQLNYQNYESPNEIANDSTITHTQKMALLEKWAEDERSLVRASGEGLNGGETSRLKPVQDVLNDLRERG